MCQKLIASACNTIAIDTKSLEKYQGYYHFSKEIYNKFNSGLSFAQISISSGDQLTVKLKCNFEFY